MQAGTWHNGIGLRPAYDRSTYKGLWELKSYWTISCFIYRALSRGREGKLAASRERCTCFQDHCLPMFSSGTGLFRAGMGQPGMRGTDQERVVLLTLEKKRLQGESYQLCRLLLITCKRSAQQGKAGRWGRPRGPWRELVKWLELVIYTNVLWNPCYMLLFFRLKIAYEGHVYTIKCISI